MTWVFVAMFVSYRRTQKRGVVNGKLLRSLLGKWPDKAENHHHDHYPVEGSCVEYLIDSQQAILWRNPRRIALLDWLIKELEE